MLKFVLVSNKRTGSTFLQEAIDSHPDIRCLDEMFMIRAKNVEERSGIKIYRKMEKEKKFSCRQYIEWLGTLHDNIGFRIVYPQLDYWRKVSDRIVLEDIPVIHLIRSNYFEQSMSWFTKNIPNKKEGMYIDPVQLKERIEKISFETDYYRRLFQNNSKYIEVFYEDMIGKRKGKKVNIKQKGAFNIRSKQKSFVSKKDANLICDLVGVENHELSSNITKRTNWDVWNYIDNEYEIKQLLIDNNWEHFIREETK